MRTTPWVTGLLALGLLVAPAGCGSARRGEPVVGLLALSPVAADGEKVFMAFCHQCHPKGEAGLAPGINHMPLPDFLVRFQVRNGLSAMPAFGPDQISDAELDALVAYLNELRRAEPAPQPAA